MSTYLSNHWHDITLLKLDPTPGSEGPFIVVQDAVDSNDPTLTQRVWILRTDGTWVDMAVHFALPKEARVRVWFDNIREVLDLLGSMPEKPTPVRHELTAEERHRSFENIEQLNLEWIHDRVKEWKLEHGD